MSLRGAVVDLGENDEDGRPITSLAIEGAPAPVLVARRLPGKYAPALLGGLREWQRGHTGENHITSADLAEICKAQKMGRQRKAEAIAALTQAGYLSPATGGHCIEL